MRRRDFPLFAAVDLFLDQLQYLLDHVLLGDHLDLDALAVQHALALARSQADVRLDRLAPAGGRGLTARAANRRVALHQDLRLAPLDAAPRAGEAAASAIPDVPQPRLHHRLGRWLAMLLEQVGLQRAAVDADADRHA